MMSPLAERYLQAQLDGSRAEALAVVMEALHQGMTVPKIHLEIVQAAQYEIGRLWETNSISIAVEHQATAISQLALSNLYDRLPRAPTKGKRVLLACVEGELHDMGSRIAADFLEMDGFEVRLLGANVPAVSLAERVEHYRPHLVALSATMTFHLPALESAIAHIRASNQRNVPILVGGRAFSWGEAIAERLDVQGFGGDAEQLVREARRLTGS
ncbi:MAG TPA: cobalamin-dependent protein [Polyangiaceae bacterium]|nr:cobalamin-dependent protein [Polyangiaceae bacterium]